MLGVVSGSSLLADCVAVHAASVDIFHWFSAQPNVKEESLTDRLLYEIERNSPHFFYRAFTRHEEARTTGADWEWWIVLPSHSVRLRIQAKKTYPAYDHYKDLAYRNKYGLQIEKLLSDAKATNSVPLYALYSTQATTTLLCPYVPQSEGAFLAGAQKIFNTFIVAGPKQAQVADLLKISTPLSCLACCAATKDPMSFIYHYFPEGMLSSDAEGSRQGIHTKLPPHIAALLERRRELPESWEREYANEIREIGAILIYDARNHGA